MLILSNKIKFFFWVLFFGGCINPGNEKKTFYETFSEDWDLDVIPLIEPLRLASVDGGETWLLDRDNGMPNTTETGGGLGQIKKIGVSKNYLFGKTESNWFFYDPKNTLCAVYKTESELINCLNSFDIPVTEIKNCSEYQNDIKKTGRCYWFPKKGQKYKDSLELIPKDIIELKVFGKDKDNMDFIVPTSIKSQKNSIYFFKMNIANKENDLLYFGINWKSYILIKDNIIVPVFIDSDMFNITLYTPYPVAQEKGISEDNRIYIKKSIKIKQ